ncbi:ATP-dependent DNA helicase RecG [Winogradskyella aurantia]|uniref:ATP-dependent DNA helicase RecG n=1 Tax=Winogradskyella aurantia TaxID=1915063 RepID=A0A265UWZ5_9FLAO|nr:ATP-dependent DNA helicase RecG [Winogradskyella aurantia]OZV69830.1 ATP-dependent DNA helicase RecG [Winogradskyella aurantia]
MSVNLQTPIDYLKGVGPNRADLLRSELGIHTYQDLINLFPNRYIDRTKYYHINELQRNNAEVQVVGVITGFREVAQKRGKRLVADFKDDTGMMELVWFRGQKWIRESLKTNQPYVVFGKANWFNGKFSMPHPEIELQTEHETNLRSAMQAIYPSTEKLSNKGITNRVVSKIMQQLFLETKGQFSETLPQTMRSELKLLSKSQALFNIHFPKSPDLLARAQFRLKFEEFFYIQLQLILKNLIHKSKIKGFKFSKVGDYFNTFYKDHLPFELTDAQKRVLKEIRSDLGSNAQMNRLLQGDVGSGKTIVAFMSMLMGLDNGFQCCLMAPTEILSVQHYNGLYELCKPLKISISLLTGSSTTLERRHIHETLENGDLQLLIGTHALLEDKVKFKNLGLAIIDEQHRFGVAQRSKLWHKGSSQSSQNETDPNEVGGAIVPPHILVMTATPIPRTLAMSVYGDLDISVIDELPAGRQPIKTVHRYDNNRLKVFRFMKDEIAKGRQIYVVYPLIQESEKMDYKDLMDGYDSISREFPMPDYQISIVHGKMKSADKDYEMQRFAKGETNIMVATTVIEVGVNVPNASVMVIESAERFGLSQLHQLRGRVGRGAEQSYCILMTGHKLSNDSKTRLETMVGTNDGFEIAEVDLRLRGPGDIMGTQQSGVLNLRIADVIKDKDILAQARYYAKQVLNLDPSLGLPEHKMILNTYRQMSKYRNIWNYIS